MTRTGSGRPAAAASPPALALGWSSMTTGIIAREVMAAAISTAMTWRGSHSGARAISRPEHRDDQRQRAEAADAAVGHDRQRLVAIGAGAEPVGGIGQPVLVQGAGEHDHGDDGDQGRGQGWQAHERGGGIGEAGQQPDDGAHQREGMDRARQIPHGHGPVELDRKPRQE